MYAKFVERVKKCYVEERVKDGVFGAMMDVQLTNDVSDNHKDAKFHPSLPRS